MDRQVYFFDMFPDYEPPEELYDALSQAAVVAADIDAAARSVSVVMHSPLYIPRRVLDQAAKEIMGPYGLAKLELASTHPESELHKVEPMELMNLFVSRNSMTRGSLAGAKWVWEDCQLTVKLLANGKKDLEELIPAVQNVLREQFAVPVSIRIEAGENLEGQALLERMQAMRSTLMESAPAAATQK